jgi:hypothetical protein
MTLDSGSRTTIHIGCSVAFKDRIKAYAARRGQSISDAVVDMLAESLKFEDFVVTTDPEQAAAADDWQKLVADLPEVP